MEVIQIIWRFGLTQDWISSNLLYILKTYFVNRNIMIGKIKISEEKLKRIYLPIDWQDGCKV